MWYTKTGVKASVTCSQYRPAEYEGN